MTTLIIIGAVIILIIVLVNTGKKNNNRLDDTDTTDEFDYSSIGAQAEKIVNDYGGALAQGSDGIARPISLLKNTKDEIKQAFKDYILGLRDYNKLTDEMYSTLSASYGYLDYFVESYKAEIINRAHRQRKDKEQVDPEDEKVYQEFITNSVMTMTDKMQELEESIK